MQSPTDPERTQRLEEYLSSVYSQLMTQARTSGH
jgi:hypothetical protein